MRSYVPYRALLVALHLLTCGLLFVYLRRRVHGRLRAGRDDRDVVPRLRVGGPDLGVPDHVRHQPGCGHRRAAAARPPRPRRQRRRDARARRVHRELRARAHLRRWPPHRAALAAAGPPPHLDRARAPRVLRGLVRPRLELVGHGQQLRPLRRLHHHARRQRDARGARRAARRRVRCCSSPSTWSPSCRRCARGRSPAGS